MNLFEQNETKTIAAFKLGDEASFAQIYKFYHDRLCRYAFFLSNNKSLSEDIVHDTFIALWEKRAHIKSTTTLKKYLYRCVYNAFIDTCRVDTKKIKVLEELLMQVAIQEEENESSIKELELSALQGFIDMLPEKRKQILLLSKIQNYKYREIAALLSISERTVEGQIRKALINLREYAVRWKVQNYMLLFLVLSKFN